MKNKTTYCRFFARELAAIEWARTLARRYTDGTIFCVVDGPEDNFAVVDNATAIELGGGYSWFA